ncbi:cbb3-type cytochrome oxidase subunit 3 [Paenibacillus sp. V4I3]|nr:cbb3-type cytochrome oxidase subunit 3 [Paenibacillus sp. V4I3]MDQ0887980.1 cbb3-type cytochrome oxidase subunit 3 [Paenibacillus sp. V4I9]
MTKPKMGLRMAWIIPNILMYIFFLGLSLFVFANSELLNDINRLGIWFVILILLLLIALFGSYRIWYWIQQGKL